MMVLQNKVELRIHLINRRIRTTVTRSARILRAETLHEEDVGPGRKVGQLARWDIFCAEDHAQCSLTLYVRCTITSRGDLFANMHGVAKRTITSGARLLTVRLTDQAYS